MELIEFAEKFGYVYLKEDDRFTTPELQEFQKNWLNEIKNNRFTITYKSREMYVTTMLAIYSAHFLIFNKEKENKIFYKAPSYDSSKYFISIVRNIITTYWGMNNIVSDFKVDNKGKIILNNDNCIRICGGIDCFLGYSNIHTIIFDEAAYIDNLEELLETSYPCNIKQTILASTFYPEPNSFHDLFISNNNVYKKIKLHYGLNKNHTEEKINEKKEILGLTGFINLYSLSETTFKIIEQPKEELKKCKTVIKSFRFEEPTLDKIAKRLIQTDKNLSEYIRNLIAKDLDDNFINIDFDKKE